MCWSVLKPSGGGYYIGEGGLGCHLGTIGTCDLFGACAEVRTIIEAETGGNEHE